MKFLRPVLLFAFVLTEITASAQAQTCAQGGSPTCGPLCEQYYNLIWDPYFTQSDCAAWQFYNGAERALSGTYCAGWSAPFGRFLGPSNGWQQIYQTTYGGSGGSAYSGAYSFSYRYEINDPLNNPNTHIEVYILQPNSTWYLVDVPPGGSQFCQGRSINLGLHSEWNGQPIQVYFWALLPGNSNIIINEVGLWQQQP